MAEKNDSTDEDENFYSNLVQRQKKKQMAMVEAARKRRALDSARMNDRKEQNRAEERLKAMHQTEEEDSLSEDSDDGGKKRKKARTQQENDEPDEFDLILQAATAPSRPSALPQSAVVAKLQQLRQRIDEVCLPSPTSPPSAPPPPSEPAEVFVHSRVKIRANLNKLGVETVDVFTTQTLEAFFRRMAERLQRPLSEVIVLRDGLAVHAHDTPNSLRLNADDFIVFDVYAEGDIGTSSQTVEEPRPEGSFEIKFQYNEKKNTMTQFVTANQTFGYLKQVYAQKNNFNMDKIYFIFDGDRIGDDSTPASLEMEDGDCIDVCVY